MNLSDRLQVIADYVPKNTIVGDIGTDHGYIPIYLIQNNISKKVIAADISKNSLDKAVENVKEYKYEDRIETRLGNGLEIIKEYEIDTVIIAGMGGILIKDIMDKNWIKRDSISNFILQPNIATNELRKYLIENSFEIVDEKLVKDGKKFYEVLYVKKGLAYVEENPFYEIGNKLIENKDPLLKNFIEYKMTLNNKIIKELEKEDSKNSRERYEILTEENRRYKEVLNKIES